MFCWVMFGRRNNVVPITLTTERSLQVAFWEVGFTRTSLCPLKIDSNELNGCLAAHGRLDTQVPVSAGHLSSGSGPVAETGW